MCVSKNISIKIHPQLNFRDCHAKIRQVDSHETLANGVVVQVSEASNRYFCNLHFYEKVSGELSNNGEPMRRFMQTFVLAPQSPKKYYVHNDIFRYQDEVSQESHNSIHGVKYSTDSLLWKPTSPIIPPSRSFPRVKRVAAHLRSPWTRQKSSLLRSKYFACIYNF